MSEAFRLHLDVKLPDECDMKVAIRLAARIMDAIELGIEENMCDEFADKNLVLQYRLGNDSDRRPHNYLDLDENGHASTKKSRFACGY